MLSCLDLSHGDETGSALNHGVSDEFSCLSLTLCSEHGCLGLLFALEDDELGTLGALLGHLLGLNGAGEVSGELQVGDGDVIENDVEFQGAFAEHVANLLGDLLSLRDELLGVVLSNDRLKHFVTNGGKNSLVVVRSDVVEDLWELGLERSEEDSESDVDSLQVLGTG